MSDLLDETMSRLYNDHMRLKVKERLYLPWEELRELILEREGLKEKIAAVMGDRKSHLACIVNTPQEVVLGEMNSAPFGLTRIVYDPKTESVIRKNAKRVQVNGNAEAIAEQYGLEVMTPQHFSAMKKTGLVLIGLGDYSGGCYLRAPNKKGINYAVIGDNFGQVYPDQNPSRITPDLGVRLELVLKR